MKKYVFFILLFSLVILSSCYHQVDQGKTPEPTQTQNTNNEAQPSEQDMNDDANQSENALTYSQYRDLCNDIAENLVLKHFNLIHNEPNYIIVDKDITFYQRQFLTVSGDQDSDTTQVRLAYATDDLEHIIFIDLSYMKKALYNDLLYISNAEPDNLEHIKLLDRYDNCILSYKNILISITHINNTPTGEVDSSITNQSVVIDTARAMVDYLLNKYEAE